MKKKVKSFLLVSDFQWMNDLVSFELLFSWSKSDFFVAKLSILVCKMYSTIKPIII